MKSPAFSTHNRRTFLKYLAGSPYVAALGGIRAFAARGGQFSASGSSTHPFEQRLSHRTSRRLQVDPTRTANLAPSKLGNLLGRPPGLQASDGWRPKMENTRRSKRHFAVRSLLIYKAPTLQWARKAPHISVSTSSVTSSPSSNKDRRRSKEHAIPESA